MPFVFAGYTFDRNVGLKFEGKDIALPPKERDLLYFLLEAGGKVMSKDDVVREVWRGGIASDESISRAVYRLRLAMQAAGGPPVVATVYNGGFRISAAVLREPDPQAASSAEVPLRNVRQIRSMLHSGREFAARLTSADTAVALHAAHAVVELEPAYVPGWLAIAEFHLLRAIRALSPARQSARQALEAVQQALALRPQCAAGLGMRGWVRAIVFGDLQEGLDDLDQALKRDADYWATYWFRAWVLQALGHQHEAVVMVRHAQALNAFSWHAAAALPQYLLYAGQPAQALEAARALVERCPVVDAVQEVMSIALSAQGLLDDALRHARRAAELGLDSPLRNGQLAYVLARLNRTDEVQQAVLAMNCPGMPSPHAAMAVVQLALGQRELAMQSLLAAKLQGLPQFFGMRDDPRMGPMAVDQDFQSLWI